MDVVETFEELLKVKFSVDVDDAREADDWWRFDVEGVEIQAGLSSRGPAEENFEVSASLGELDSSRDEEYLPAITEANSDLPSGPKLVDTDGYLNARHSIDAAAATNEALAELVADVIKLAKSDKAAALYSAYRSWDD